jgi:hypothetical protein
VVLDRYRAVGALLGVRQLRAVARGLGTSVDATPPAEPDPALVDPASAPFESVTDAEERLETLQSRLRADGDRRAVFLTVYARMTRDVRRQLGTGAFENPEWMRDYTVTFAEYYRRAFLAFERGRVEAVPDPWLLAFGTALEGDALIMQDAILGINAHINYDLALAVRDVGIGSARASKYRDHREINDVLAGLVDEQQRTLADIYAAGIADVDALLGPFDEFLAGASLAEAREQAWRVAVVLSEVSVPLVEVAARWLLRTTALGGATVVLSPGIDPELLATLERIERRDHDLAGVLAHVDDRLHGAY